MAEGSEAILSESKDVVVGKQRSLFWGEDVGGAEVGASLGQTLILAYGCVASQLISLQRALWCFSQQCSGNVEGLCETHEGGHSDESRLLRGGDQPAKFLKRSSGKSLHFNTSGDLESLMKELPSFEERIGFMSWAGSRVPVDLLEMVQSQLIVLSHSTLYPPRQRVKEHISVDILV